MLLFWSVSQDEDVPLIIYGTYILNLISYQMTKAITPTTLNRKKQHHEPIRIPDRPIQLIQYYT